MVSQPIKSRGFAGLSKRVERKFIYEIRRINIRGFKKNAGG